MRLTTPLGGITKLLDFLVYSRFIVIPAKIDDGNCFFAVIACVEGCKLDQCCGQFKSLKAFQKNTPGSYEGILTCDDITEYLTYVNTKY